MSLESMDETNKQLILFKLVSYFVPCAETNCSILSNPLDSDLLWVHQCEELSIAYLEIQWRIRREFAEFVAQKWCKSFCCVTVLDQIRDSELRSEWNILKKNIYKKFGINFKLQQLTGNGKNCTHSKACPSNT